MNENLKQLHDLMVQHYDDIPKDYSQFAASMQNPETAKQVHGLLVSDGYGDVPKDFNSFEGALGLKKKESSPDSQDGTGAYAQESGMDSQGTNSLADVFIKPPSAYAHLAPSPKIHLPTPQEQMAHTYQRMQQGDDAVLDKNNEFTFPDKVNESGFIPAAPRAAPVAHATLPVNGMPSTNAIIPKTGQAQETNTGEFNPNPNQTPDKPFDAKPVEEFLFNNMIQKPVVGMIEGGKALGKGLEEMNIPSEFIKAAAANADNDGSSPISSIAQEALNAPLKTIAGAAGLLFGAAGFTPAGATFNLASGMAEDAAPNATSVIMSPLQSTAKLIWDNPDDEPDIIKNGTNLGDVALNLWAMHKVGKGIEKLSDKEVQSVNNGTADKATTEKVHTILDNATGGDLKQAAETVQQKINTVRRNPAIMDLPPEQQDAIIPIVNETDNVKAKIAEIEARKAKVRGENDVTNPTIEKIVSGKEAEHDTELEDLHTQLETLNTQSDEILNGEHTQNAEPDENAVESRASEPENSAESSVEQDKDVQSNKEPVTEAEESPINTQSNGKSEEGRKGQAQAAKEADVLNSEGSAPSQEGADTEKDNYRGRHQIVKSEDNANLDNMTKGGELVPEDFYTHPHYYANMDEPSYKESWKVIKKAKGNPDEDVTIYRSVPKGVDKINEGDWVTLSKTYAKEHGMHPTDPKQDMPVISMKVKAKDISWDGNDINEFSYHPGSESTSTRGENDAKSSKKTEPAIKITAHGEGENDVKKLVSGRTGERLSPKGVREAQAKGKEWKAEFEQEGVPKEKRKVVTSPEKRALDTAKHAAKQAGISPSNIVTHEGLNAIHLGDFSKMKEKEFTPVLNWFIDHPDEKTYLPENKAAKHYGKSMGETLNEAGKRVAEAHKDLTANYPAEETRAVTHGHVRGLLQAIEDNGGKWNADALKKFGESEKPGDIELRTPDKENGQNQPKEGADHIADTSKKVEGEPEKTVGSENYKSGKNQVEGKEKTKTLPNGEKIKGVYKVVSADDIIASHHEQSYKKSENFPTDKNGKTVNDRDYETDSNAQREVQTMAEKLDDRAIENTPVVSKDGVVLGGNNRTMSRKLAAKLGTDKAYIEHLKGHADMYGIDHADIDKIKNPMLVFESKTDMPYTTDTFRKFNAADMKEKSPIAKAIEITKIITDKARNAIFDIYAGAERPSDITSNKGKVKDIIHLFQEHGLIQPNELPRYFDTEKFTTTKDGTSLLESVLLGSALKEDVIHALNAEGMGDIKNKILSSIVHLVKNSSLGDNSLIDEMGNAIHLLNESKSKGISIADHINTQDLFEPKKYSVDEVALAYALDGKFKDFIKNYNENVGQTTLMEGVRSKEQIAKDYLKGKGINYERLQINEHPKSDEPTKQDGGNSDDKGTAKETSGATDTPNPKSTKPAEPGSGETAGEPVKESSKKLSEKIANFKKESAIALDNWKINTDGQLQVSLPLLKETWNGAIDVLKEAVSGAATIAESIAKAIEFIKASDFYKGLNKQQQDLVEAKFHSDITAMLKDEIEQEKAEGKAPPENRTIGVTNADTEAQRNARGVSQIEKEARQHNSTLWDEVSKQIENGDINAPDTVKALAEAKHPEPTDRNQAIILHDRIRISNEMEINDKALESAYENKDLGNQEVLEIQKARLEQEMDNNEVANTKIGTEWGRLGQFRQRLANRDYSLSSILRRAKNDNLGHPLDAKTEQKFRDLAKEHEALKKEYDEWKQRHSEEAARRETEFEAEKERYAQQKIDELRESMGKEKPKPENDVQKRKRQADAFRKKFKTKPLEILGKDGKPIHIELMGGSPYDALVEAVAQGIEKYGEIEQAVKETVKRLKGVSDEDKEEIEKQLREHFAEKPKSITEQFIEKAGGDLHEGTDALLRKMVREKVEQGITTINGVVDAIHEDIKEHFPDLTKRELRDAISGYGKFKELSKNDVDTQIRELTKQGRLDSSLEDVDSNKLPLRTGLERDLPSNETREKQRTILQKIKEKGLEPEPTQEQVAAQWRSAEQAHQRRLENAIADTEKEIATGERIKKAEPKKYTDAKSLGLQERLKELQKLKKEKFGIDEQNRINASIRGLNKSIENLGTKIDLLKKGKYQEALGTEAKKPVTNETIAELRKLKDQLTAERDALVPENIKDELAYKKWKEGRQRRLDFLENIKAEKRYEDKRQPKYNFAKSPLDKEGEDINARIKKNEEEIKYERSKLQYKNKTFIQKAMEGAVNLQHSAVIGSPIASAKVAASAIIRPFQYTAKDLIAIPFGIISPEIYGTPKANLKSIAARWSTLMTGSTWKDSWLALKGEQTKWGNIQNSRPAQKFSWYYKYPALDHFLGILGYRVHKALKEPVMFAEYKAASARLNEMALRSQMNITEPAVSNVLDNMAITQAASVGFMQDNAINDQWKMWLATSKPVTRFIMSTLNPVVKMPSNFAIEVMQHVFGILEPARAAIQKEYGKMTFEQKNKFRNRTLNGLIGAAVFAYYWENYQQMGGLQKQKENNLPIGAVTIGDKVYGNALKDKLITGVEAPLLAIGQLAATSRYAYNKHQSALEAGGAMGTGLATKLPYFENVGRTYDDIKEGQWQNLFGNYIKTYLPGALRFTAQAMDTDENGVVTKRKAGNILQNIELDIPGARKTVPSADERKFTDLMAKRKAKAERDDELDANPEAAAKYNAGLEAKAATEDAKEEKLKKLAKKLGVPYYNPDGDIEY